MSSPDYNDEETMDILSARDIMMVSDPSDSDSTILASEPPQRRLKAAAAAASVPPVSNAYTPAQENTEHRIVIQVKGPDKDATAARNTSPRQNRRRGNLSNPELVPTSTAQNTVQRPTGNTTPEFVGYQVRHSFIRYYNLYGSREYRFERRNLRLVQEKILDKRQVQVLFQS